MKKNYEDFNDLDKIDCLKLLDEDGQSGENENEKNRICRSNKCKIPCQCAPCCTSNGQCKEHKIQHVDLFDEVKHAVIVRSTEDFSLFMKIMYAFPRHL